MPIPDYQTLMFPLLQQLEDKKEKSLKELIDALATLFKLSEDEKSQLLPSGQSFLFANRVGWSRTYLKKAGLIANTKRGILVITERGRTVLKQKPKQIDNKFLKQFPEFVEFQSIKRKDDYDISVTSDIPQLSDFLTP